MRDAFCAQLNEEQLLIFQTLEVPQWQMPLLNLVTHYPGDHSIMAVVSWMNYVLSALPETVAPCEPDHMQYHPVP